MRDAHGGTLGAGDHPSWKVLLLGGSSGIGKTIIAGGVGRHFGVAWAQVDDLRLALQELTAPKDQPALHFFLTHPDVWSLPAEELRDRLIEVGKVVSRCLEIVIGHHVATANPLVLEGDGIVPEMAARHVFAGSEERSDVRAIFLFEPDEDALFKNMRERPRGGFLHRPPAMQRAQARMAWLYGLWLREQAMGYGLPVLEVRPRSTLVDRILEVLE